MRLISNRPQLHGSYGTVVFGQQFEVEEDVARQLLRSGAARLPDPPRVLYETKVVVPEAPEVGARLPFRDVPLPDPQPPAVAAEGDSVLPAADVPQPGTAHPGGRRKRKGPGSPG